MRELIGDSDVAAAYAVQKINNDLRVAVGGRVVGLKIGLTSLAVQKQLGVDQPDFGLLFADTEVKNGSGVLASTILQPKAEAEIAFVMRTALAGADVTRLDLAALIRSVQKPPFDKVGVFDVDSFFPAKDRTELALRINGLLAQPAATGSAGTGIKQP